MQVQIRFTAGGSSALTGNFAPGDLLRCSAEHARHLVEEARCAAYVVAPAAPEEQPTKPRAARKTAKDQA
jgi:hypothetical protein